MTPQNKQGTKAARRQRRLERKAQEEAAARRAERLRRLRTAVVAGVVLLGLGAGGYLLARPDPELEGVERPPNRGRDHVSASQIGYDTAAPTSGPHLASAPRCGAYSQPLELPLAVHGLEHGAVVVWYRADLDDELRGPLRDLLSEWDSHWILSPNAGIEEPIVATAWNRRMTFEEPGERLREFVDTYRRRGPERVDCDA